MRPTADAARVFGLRVPVGVGLTGRKRLPLGWGRRRPAVPAHLGEK